MYEQKICYIDLYRNGVKCGNMGHVRIEWDESHYRFSANLCHMERQTLVTALLERTGGRPRTTIQNIAIIHGKGSAQFDWMPLEGNEESLLFQASGEIYGICRLPKMIEMQKQEETLPADQAAPASTAGVQDGEKRDGMPEAASHETEKQSEMLQNVLRTMEKQDGNRNAEGEISSQADRNPDVDVDVETVSREIEGQSRIAEEIPFVAEKPEGKKQRGDRETVVLKYPQNIGERRQRERYVTTLSDDKWKQLCSIYPTVHPIGDDVDFIRIAPTDFVVLRQEYQNLVRNSFLLHGYYNYNHVLLGKYPDKYYIGVPGIMHEQERIAAAMFGFVGFEHAEAPKEQKENRDCFGYYMMEVGI